MGWFSRPEVYVPGSRSSRSSRSGSSVASSNSSSSKHRRPSSSSTVSSTSSSSSRRHRRDDPDFDYEAYKREKERKAHKLAKQLEERERERDRDRDRAGELDRDRTGQLDVQPEFLQHTAGSSNTQTLGEWEQPSDYMKMARSSSPSRSSSHHHHHHGSSTSAYKRRPREGFIKAVVHKLKRLLKKLARFMRKHPIKIVFWLLLPLLTGGLIVSFFRKFNIRMPAILTAAITGLGKMAYSKHARRALTGAGSTFGIKELDLKDGASFSTIFKVVRQMI